ncbi:MAG: hypothetical protein WBE91_09380, partial [Steroidobacteraceae bacterium]
AVLPRSHDVALRRAIFLTRELYEAVHGQHSSDAETTRYAVLQVRATTVFDRRFFTIGDGQAT